MPGRNSSWSDEMMKREALGRVSWACKTKVMKVPCVYCVCIGRYGGVTCPICEGRCSLEVEGTPTLSTCGFCVGVGRYGGTTCRICRGIGRLTEDGKPPTLRSTQNLPPGEPVHPGGFTLVADSRLAQLHACTPTKLDFKKLIRLCDELNTAYSQGCYLAVIMLTRSLLDHVAPAFGKTKFTEVVNNYGGGGRSFTEVMQGLEDAARKIADAYLHMPMRAVETLPTPQQVNFGPQLDTLLAEVVRITP